MSTVYSFYDIPFMSDCIDVVYNLAQLPKPFSPRPHVLDISGTSLVGYV